MPLVQIGLIQKEREAYVLFYDSELGEFSYAPCGSLKSVLPLKKTIEITPHHIHTRSIIGYKLTIADQVFKDHACWKGLKAHHFTMLVKSAESKD